MKTLFCVHLFMHMYIDQSERSVLSASEMLFSLIEDHRRPSTPRPHGTAARRKEKKKYSQTS